MRKAQRICGVLIAFLISISAFPQIYPSNFSQSLVVSGINNPTVMAFVPDGRIFIAQKNGRLRVIKEGVLLSKSFVQLTVSSVGERGLIGIALDPNFNANQFVYLYYTVPGTPAHNRVSRFTADGDIAIPGSELIILELDSLTTATNHNGGALAFGSDEKLYIAAGDNGNGANAQNLDTSHGKILRVNSDGSVPADNPFSSGTEQKKRVWAYGLRNPYTISFQPGTGKFFVNDVGQKTWEEINDATQGGLNFGWPTTEGIFNPITYPNFTNPVYTYQHGSGDGLGCAITGGTFFNPVFTNYPGMYYGSYFFLDFCGQWINYINPSESPSVRTSFAPVISGSPVIMEVGSDGNLYYLSRSDNSLYKIIYESTSEPYITNHPADVETLEGSTSTFTVSTIGSAPFTYQWQKNSVDIEGAVSSSIIISNVDLPDEGQYRVIVSNIAGNATSNAATLSVIPVNDAPVAVISSPIDESLYAAGTTISYSGIGTDIEDGVLPASAFTWRFDFHHDTHVHGQPAISGITSGTFDIPSEGEMSDNVWYRIFLTVTDSEGLTSTDSVDIFPRKSLLSFSTYPAGLQVILDGQLFDTPGSVVSVEGMQRTIGVVSPQALGEIQYGFTSWEHGGEASQTITVSADDTEYTANFSVIAGIENLDHIKDLQIYPNPIEDESVVLKILSPLTGEGFLQIMSSLSSNNLKLSVSLVAGENSIKLPISNLSKGMYIVIVEVGNERKAQKIWVK